MALREMFIDIGFQVDPAGLTQADAQADAFRDNLLGAQARGQELGATMSDAGAKSRQAPTGHRKRGRRMVGNQPRNVESLGEQLRNIEYSWYSGVTIDRRFVGQSRRGLRAGHVPSGSRSERPKRTWLCSPQARS